jgi:hypothetical protein
MMKIAAFAFAATVAVQASSMQVPVRTVSTTTVEGAEFTLSEIKEVKSVGAVYEFCEVCIELVVGEINYLLNYIANVGVIADCSDLCHGAIPKSKPEEQDVCTDLCDAVGLGAFIEAISKDGNDIDPIAPCVALDLCQYVPGGKAKVDSIAVTPAPAKLGDLIVADITYTILNETSTGDLIVNILTGSGEQVTGHQELMLPTQPGSYRLEARIQSGKDNNKSRPPINKAGTYEVQFQLCAGICGSPWEKAMTYVNATQKFTISA